MFFSSAKVRQSGTGRRTRILVNHRLFKTVPAGFFEPGLAREDFRKQDLGRGSASVFSHEGSEYVRKHYHRGGYPGRFIRDLYLFTGLRRTRMWREFHLLLHLHDLGLPVPLPVAARCQLAPPLCYRGDLVTRFLPGTQPLAAVLQASPLSRTTWASIGKSVALFHRYNVFHADLNAANILLHREKGVFLLDFDKSALRRRNKPLWTKANLERLARSLWKWKGKAASFHFSESDWRSLEEGYRFGTGAH